MTQVGFTSGDGKYYEPRDLTIVKAYHFEDVINPSESFNVHIMKDSDGIRGYSIDATVHHEINEEMLYHAFSTKKVPETSPFNKYILKATRELFRNNFFIFSMM